MLDNFYWLETPSRDLCARINETGTVCVNLAVDENRLKDVTEGIIPREVYATAREYPYPADPTTGRVHPLTLLRAQSKPGDTIVLSVRGNDLRVNIPTLLFGAKFLLASVFTPSYVERLTGWVRTLQDELKLNVVFVSVYSHHFSGIYDLLKEFAKDVIGGWLKCMTVVFRPLDVPVIDLYHTFDPTCRAHYGSTEIEPSELSSDAIARCILAAEGEKRFCIISAPRCGDVVVSPST